MRFINKFLDFISFYTQTQHSTGAISSTCWSVEDGSFVTTTSVNTELIDVHFLNLFSYLKFQHIFIKLSYLYLTAFCRLYAFFKLGLITLNIYRNWKNVFLTLTITKYCFKIYLYANF